MTGQINVNKIAARTGTAITVESGHVITQPGSVIQVVRNQDNTTNARTNSTSSSYFDVAIWTASITPKFANSLIRIDACAAGLIRGATNQISLKLLRDSTTVIETTRWLFTEQGGTWEACNSAFTGYDSPNTTSAITYKIQLKNKGTTNDQIQLGGYDSTGNGFASFTVMEIAQ